MPRQSPIVKLRNAMSHVIFAHKENMQQGTYKILYETLGMETKDVSEEDELVWCKFTYIKSKVKTCQMCAEREDEGATQASLSVNICRRNIRVKRKTYERMKKLLDEYDTIGTGLLIDNDSNALIETQRQMSHFQSEFNESFLFDDDENIFTIIKIKLIE